MDQLPDIFARLAESGSIDPARDAGSVRLLVGTNAAAALGCMDGDLMYVAWGGGRPSGLPVWVAVAGGLEAWDWRVLAYGVVVDSGATGPMT